MTFERIVMGYIEIVFERLNKLFVTNAENKYTMKKLCGNRPQFKNFLYHLEAMDVNRLGGNLQEDKRYFSGKHKLYGFKTEVSPRPNGIAVSCSKHYPGSVSDLSIMPIMSEMHEDRLENGMYRNIIGRTDFVSNIPKSQGCPYGQGI